MILTAAEIPVVPLALLGAGFVIIAGLALAIVSRSRRRADPGETSTSPVPVDNLVLTRLYHVIGEALAAVAGQPEWNHKDAVTDKLVALGVQFRPVASGAEESGGTESWYVAHDAILTIPDLKEYRAGLRVITAECARDGAWVHTSDYWQDAPGRQSMRVNVQAAARGVSIGRVVILPEDLWPANAQLPVSAILPWIEEQHRHGLLVSLVRESEVAREPDLLADIGIYGSEAVGEQELDEDSRTLRFTLDLDPQAVRAAEDRWRRLALYTTSFKSLCDQT